MPIVLYRAAGPTPSFSQDERLPHSARPPWQTQGRNHQSGHRGVTTGRDGSVAKVPSRLYSDPIRIPTPHAEKPANTSVDGDKVICASSTGSVAPFSGTGTGTGTGSAERVVGVMSGGFGVLGGKAEGEEKSPTPWLRQRQVR